MSKLADKIRKTSRSEPQSIGFMATRAAKEPTMLLVGIARNASEGSDLLKRGADAVVVDGDGDAGDLKDAVAGAWLRAKADAKSLRAAGFDFVVFDPDATPSTAVLEEEIGYVLALPASLGDVELRTLESFQLDAINVGQVDAALTVRKQIDLRRVYALTRKPLMAGVPATISVEQLQALRDTNVAVVAVSGSDAVEKLRKTIDALPARVKRKDEDRPFPMVPRTTGADDEEDDEEGDS